MNNVHAAPAAYSLERGGVLKPYSSFPKIIMEYLTCKLYKSTKIGIYALILGCPIFYWNDKIYSSIQY